MNDKDCACYGKSLIFQLLPDVFDWFYGVVLFDHNKLTTTSTTRIDLHRVY